MATLEDILAATKVLAENSGNRCVESCSKTEENRKWTSDIKKKDGNAAAADEGIVEGETVVESSLGSLNCLGKIEKEKVVVGNLSSLSTGGKSESDKRVGVDGSSCGVLSRDEKIEDGDYSCTDNGLRRASDSDKLDVIGQKSSYADVDGCEKGLVNGEKLEDWDHAFHVGDMVWGKIKSHPWWPGQVYDPRDASDFAMKRRQDGRLLVGFFGDGSCSWCLPLQLKPLVENFKEMSVGSASKSFVNAVQSAVDEIGRLVEAKMTCGCVSMEKRDGLARPLVTNAGIKAGVLVPDVDIRRFSVPEYEPIEILARVTQFAKGCVDNVLELAILRSWLSAFCRANGVYPLPIYCEPFHIEGMEDRNKIVTEDTNDFSVPIEVPILGPLEDDWVSSPACNSTKSHASSGDKTYHRRKQKSVAELMGENPNDKPGNPEETTIKERKVGKSTSSKKKKKSNKKNSNNGELEEGGAQGDSSTGSLGRKRKVEVNSPNIASKKVSNTEYSSSGDDVNKGTSSGKSKKFEVAAENTSSETKEEAEMVSTPRERKKSKYLCPPYTTPSWRIGNSSFKMETTSDKTPKVDDVGEHVTEASGVPSASASALKSVDKLSDVKVMDDNQKGPDATVKESSWTAENSKKITVAASDVDVPVDELVSNIQSAALDPCYLSKEGCLDTVYSFVSALRSSVYLHGPNYKVHQKCKTGSKRKSLATQQGNQENDVSNEKVKSAEKRVPEEKKTERKPDPAKFKSKSKKATEILDGNASSCLLLKFAAEYPLPSKEEIVRLFGKFGSLNKRETHAATDSHSVQIVYTKESDAEAAFKSSVSEKPFGQKNVVDYRLQLSSGASKSHASHAKVTSRKRAPEKPSSSQPTSDDLLMDVRVIRQKLDIMTAILDNYHLKFSPEDKSGLRDEMRTLLENVETASEKVRVLAENSPA